jgi:pimeloyl-ACP methyl ester carboxylesterase
MRGLSTTRWPASEPVGTAVALHGITSNAQTWSEVARLLAVEFRITTIAPDLPGHGNSAGSMRETALHDVVEAVVQSTEEEPDILLGHSFGGTVALLAAVSRRCTPRLLVLIDPVLSLTREKAEATICSEEAAVADDMAKVAAAAPRWSAEAVVAKILSRQQADFAVARALFQGNAPWDLRRDLVLVANRLPCVVLAPERSPYLQPDDLDALAETRRGRAVIVPRSGHAVHRDNLASTVEAITEAWAAVSSPSHPSLRTTVHRTPTREEREQ